MAYTKTVWENAPSTATPINATRLNNIEDGIEALDTKLDEIIESGSNSNGNWIKWADGTMICYRTINAGGATTGGSADGALYYVDILSHYNFASTFNSTPNVTARIYTNSGQTYHGLWISTKYNSVTTTYFGNYRIYSPTNTTMNISIEIIAVGRWKA